MIIQRIFIASAVFAIAFAFSLSLQAKEMRHFDIAGQPLAKALLEFSKQSDRNVMVPSQLVSDKQSSPIKGDMSPEDALNMLLQGSDLSARTGKYGALEIYPQFADEGDPMASAVALNSQSAPILAGSDKPKYIEEVIVTAEKRKQNVQDVPVAISVFNSEMLNNKGISSPEDMQYMVPSLIITENFNGGSAKVTLRGIGADNWGPAGDPGVPIHIDGHYSQATAYVLRDFLDVERVEVQRGPQGTLYGRNAIGGNINIITKRPTEEFEGLISVQAGNYEKRQIQAILSGPLADGVRGRLAISDDKREGYVKNVASESDYRNTSDYTSVRGALEIDISENVGVYIKAYSFDDKGDEPTLIINDNSSHVTNNDPFKMSTNEPPGRDDKSWGSSIDVVWGMDKVEFRSLSAYDDTLKNNGILDIDGGSLIRSEAIYEIGYKTFSQEFQLVSDDSENMKWVSGIFYFKQESDMYFEALIDNNPGTFLPRTWVVSDTDLEASSIGMYGQVDYSLTEKIDLVMGLRYSKDEKKQNLIPNTAGVEGSLSPIIGQPIIKSDNEWSKITGKFGVNYHVNEKALLYASYSRGYKAGGMAPRSPSSYDPEFVDAFEIGLKSEWLDSRIQTNYSAFLYDYSDMQVNQRIPSGVAGNVVVQLVNAGAATVHGLEAEIKAIVTDNLSLDMSLSYLDAQYDKFDTIDRLYPGLGVQDLSGNKLPYSPKWKFYTGIQHEWLLNNNLGRITLRGDYSWVDSQWSDAFNRSSDGAVIFATGDHIPSYSKVDARLNWSSEDDAWSAEFYIENLTDEEILLGSFLPSSGVASGMPYVTFSPPRTYGVKLSYQF